MLVKMVKKSELKRLRKENDTYRDKSKVDEERIAELISRCKELESEKDVWEDQCDKHVKTINDNERVISVLRLDIKERKENAIKREEEYDRFDKLKRTMEEREKEYEKKLDKLNDELEQLKANRIEVDFKYREIMMSNDEYKKIGEKCEYRFSDMWYNYIVTSYCKDMRIYVKNIRQMEFSVFCGGKPKTLTRDDIITNILVPYANEIYRLSNKKCSDARYIRRGNRSFIKDNMDLFLTTIKTKNGRKIYRIHKPKEAE